MGEKTRKASKPVLPGYKVRVSRAALMARLNRRLAQDGQQLKATRGERLRGDLGDFWILDINRNLIVAKDVDPVRLARELDVLKPYEVAVGFEEA